jgi:hypothetical protein
MLYHIVSKSLPLGHTCLCVGFNPTTITPKALWVVWFYTFLSDKWRKIPGAEKNYEKRPSKILFFSCFSETNHNPTNKKMWLGSAKIGLKCANNTSIWIRYFLVKKCFHSCVNISTIHPLNQFKLQKSTAMHMATNVYRGDDVRNTAGGKNQDVHMDLSAACQHVSCFVLYIFGGHIYKMLDKLVELHIIHTTHLNRCCFEKNKAMGLPWNVVRLFRGG